MKALEKYVVYTDKLRGLCRLHIKRLSIALRIEETCIALQSYFIIYQVVYQVVY